MSKQHRSHVRRKQRPHISDNIQNGESNHQRKNSNRDDDGSVQLSSDEDYHNDEQIKYTRRGSKNQKSHRNGTYERLHVNTEFPMTSGARPKENNLLVGHDYRGLSPRPITPSGSQSRRCVSRKDLREISPDKLNITQVCITSGTFPFYECVI